MNNKLKTGAILGLAVLLGACGALPRSQYSGDAMKSIKTIIVETPPKTQYFAESVGASPIIVLPGVGIAAAAAISATVGALTPRDNPTFNDLVTAQIGESDLNRRFFDQIESALREQGYEVREVDGSAPDMPKTILQRGQIPKLEGAAYRGADAIMAVAVKTGYYSAGVFEPYVRNVNVNIAIFKADTLKPIFRDRLLHYAMHDNAYNYSRFSDVTSDLPHAIHGIDEAMMNFVPEFDADMQASRGIPSPTARTKDFGSMLH
ncbi:hypothetical protein [Paraburkholderia sp.]|uniref:hypothetical protein n=1 Tax=Paraburkholderia sp. TaxID=1926495 RepID=UPI0025FFC428|nr:hypothetical protein [Paraburkholderia sp.]